LLLNNTRFFNTKEEGVLSSFFYAKNTYNKNMFSLSHFPFLIPLLVLFLADCTKIILEGIKTGEWSHEILRSGGMPSGHTALVVSLVVVVGQIRGIESIEFAIAMSFAILICYDAMNARRAIGEQAKALNRLQQWTRFSERVGHSAKEVFGGALFGVVTTTLLLQW
jgi:acid phosphatase family membrane protein YuiD